MNSKASYSTKTLIDIERELTRMPTKVVLTGRNLTIAEIVAVARYNAPVYFTEDTNVLKRIDLSYQKMLKQVKNGIPIYGCNTGYGARASNIVNKGSPKNRIDLAKKVSEGIAHIDVSVGPVFSKEIVRAAILIRINMLMQGVSAVKLADLEIYRLMLNRQITPVVNQYGGIGASGDLAHNCRVLSAARQLKGVRVWDKNGNIREAREALREAKVPELKLDPKAGLGLVNGDNFSTGIASLLAYDTVQSLLLASVAGSMVVEVLRGSDRSFHPLLSNVRPHAGQKEVSAIYRYLLKGSKLAYQEMKGHMLRPDGVKVQDGYSLRCISQYHGVNFEKIKGILDVITTNANSVSDNPLWVAEEYATNGEEPWQWVSGGNFIAMHMVEAIDSMRKIMTQIVKLNDRHLARLVQPRENNGLAANLSDPSALTQCSFKGTQIQSGMFEVYSSLLSIPVSTFFGVHEEGNQDITSHALTSGILAMENLRLVRYSIAQNFVALAQATDLRGGGNKLSIKTQPVYRYLRSKIEYVKRERPLNNDIEIIFEDITNGKLMDLMRVQVYVDFIND